MAQSFEPAMKQMTAPPREEIAAIVGAANIRSATPADQVDGVLPGIVVEPGTQEELGKVLACAGRAGLAVIPRGGGTKIGWGNPPRRADLVLSTARLNGILEHAWGDMTATVQAGCKVAQFQRTLAEHGQRMARAVWFFARPHHRRHARFGRRNFGPKRRQGGKECRGI